MPGNYRVKVQEPVRVMWNGKLRERMVGAGTLILTDYSLAQRISQVINETELVEANISVRFRNPFEHGFIDVPADKPDDVKEFMQQLNKQVSTAIEDMKARG